MEKNSITKSKILKCIQNITFKKKKSPIIHHMEIKCNGNDVYVRKYTSLISNVHFIEIAEWFLSSNTQCYKFIHETGFEVFARTSIESINVFKE